MTARTPPAVPPPAPLGRRGRTLVLGSVLAGWMFAGVEMSLMVPVARPAIQDFLSAARTAGSGEAARASTGGENERLEISADRWLSWYLAAFLLGAALGGLVFGWVGDRWGRVKAMGASIICYSLFTAAGYGAAAPEQLLVLRFVACTGIGGMWPSGVALASEAWPRASRPAIAGLIGTSANVGFLALGVLMLSHPVTRDSWRWVLLLGGAPILLGVAVLYLVPESPLWLSGRNEGRGRPGDSPVRRVFRPPLLGRTLLGIALGTVPLLGGWASGQRLIPWAGQIGEREGLVDLKAVTQTWWASGAVLGSLGGGWLASLLGRRASYFAMSLGALLLSLWIFLALEPTRPVFPAAVFALGVVATSFFGWLPYFLPELFPTPVRATGAGVSYNFGRILSALAMLSTASLSAVFRGDVARMGAAASLIYAAGLAVVWFIPRREANAE